MKPSIPRGTRDFGPAEMQKRQYILDTIRKNFRLFGFEQIETPAMENIETLTGKYGEEGDQLIYKILNSRLHESKTKEFLMKEFESSLQSSRNSPELTGKALRYDLTVPFARFVVMNQHHLVFPFRRFQIQPVWRADKPQKGRYREFCQCDADIIGSQSLTNELELVQLIIAAFRELNLSVRIRLNNRKILSGIAEKINATGKITEITVAIDKFDKIGADGVMTELRRLGINEDGISELIGIISIRKSHKELFAYLRSYFNETGQGMKGLEELEFLFTGIADIQLPANIVIEPDVSLARGLNYYTGTIFEVSSTGSSMQSSILGGGRYDDLTGIFGLKGMSGVGISFGVDRIYDVMEELKLFPQGVTGRSVTKILFTHFDEAGRNYCLQAATALRNKGISCEVYPDIIKIKKQFDYANKKNIPFVCIAGESEMASGTFAFKNMASGEQKQAKTEQIPELINSTGNEIHN